VSPPLIHLERCFPKLAAAGYDKTSDATGYPPTPGAYNCIAWAADDPRKKYFWWPDPDSYWPFWIKREESVSCFVKTFRWLGYRLCDSSCQEPSYDKIVLYAIHRSRQPTPVPTRLEHFHDWEPTHMARQLPDGSWTSKLGGSEDITHFTLDALECYGPRYGMNRKDEYGCPVLYMKRHIRISSVVRRIQEIQLRFDQ
jgi:hypothetical protein